MTCLSFKHVSHILSQFFYYIDLFKSPLTLNFNKKRYISTKLGSFSSLAILSFLFTILIKSDLFEKSMPITQTSNLPQSHRPFIKLDHRILAIGVQDDENFKGFVDPTVFSIKVTNYFAESVDSGGYNFSQKIDKKLHECSEQDFKDPALFDELGLAKSFCLETADNTMEFEGFYDESSLKYTEIELFLCDNSTSNVSCKGFNEISRLLNGKTINIYFQDSILDANDFLNPIKRNIVNKYQYIDIQFKKTMELYFQALNVRSDDGLIFSQMTQYSDAWLSAQNSDFFSVENDDLTTSRFSIYIYSDKSENQIQRSYITLSDLLARLGGLLQSLMFVSYLFIYFEHSLYLKNKILNALFIFHRSESNTKTLPTSERRLNFSKCHESNPRGQNIMRNLHPLESSSSPSFINTFKVIESKKIPNRRLKLTIFGYMIYKLKSMFPFAKLSLKEQMFGKSEKLYEKKVDYIEVLKKLQDIDKMKQVFLNNKQQILFNFLSKPLVYFRESQGRIKHLSVPLDLHEIGSKEQLKGALEFYQEMKKKNELSEVDQRLLDMLYENARRI